VHIVDDDDSHRVAMSRLLSAAGHTTLTYASAGDFLLEHPSMPQGCLLLDLHMPGPDGLALQEALRQRGWTIPVIFLSGRGDIRTSVKALKTGAHDFLTKPVNAQTLFEAIAAALGADAVAQEKRNQDQDRQARFAQLNLREREVLQMVLLGSLTRDIANALRVSERTIKTIRASIMEKFGAGSLAELVAKATDASR
jgi:FixJ family two-component response regulator